MVLFPSISFDRNLNFFRVNLHLLQFVGWMIRSNRPIINSVSSKIYQVLPTRSSCFFMRFYDPFILMIRNRGLHFSLSYPPPYLGTIFSIRRPIVNSIMVSWHLIYRILFRRLISSMRTSISPVSVFASKGRA